MSNELAAPSSNAGIDSHKKLILDIRRLNIWIRPPRRPESWDWACHTPDNRRAAARQIEVKAGIGYGGSQFIG
jgi:hypothetical protein